VLAISFDTEAIAFEQVVAIIAGVLRDLPDPLYTRELEVRYAGR
jgi:hypothetical protein